jgi:hypothetical protein
MSLNIVQTLRSLPQHEQARLIGSSYNYIKNDNFNNLLQLYDINNKKNDARLISQLNMFATVPDIKEQVSAWLNS